jgi:hydrogenase maturation protease
MTLAARRHSVTHIGMASDIAIIGVGNYLMGDEGAGVHAIAILKKTKLPDRIKLIDAGTPGPSLIHMMEGKKAAIIIDCADFGGRPGEVKCFDARDLLPEKDAKVSMHAADLMGVIALACQLGLAPEKITIVGIQPKDVSMGTRLSEEASAALSSLPKLLKTLLDQVD